MLNRVKLAMLLTLVFAAQACAAARPNIVWLVSEDNSKHFVKLFDESGASMPTIEKLAKRGLVFERAFSNAPVCSTARTTLATGCYGPRIGTQYHRREKLAEMPHGLNMFMADLRKAGYYTANKSKKDYNAVESAGSWDESSGKATWRKRKAGQPFFFMQSFGVTHEGSLHFPAKQMNNPTQTDPASVKLSPKHPDTPTFRYTYARYHDRHKEFDKQAAQVVAQLEADGLMDDTFIFYFGDHGGVLPGSKGYAYEVGLHVPLVVYVPKNFQHLVDAEPGTRHQGFVSFVDFGPTALNLAGVKVSNKIDGKPFLGKGVKMAEVNRRDETFGYADRFDEKYDLVRTYRKGDFKYMRNYQPFNIDGLENNYRYKALAYKEWRKLYAAGELNEVQSQFFKPRAPEALYDLSVDPYETNNLAGKPEHAKKLAEMRNALNAWVKAMPDLSFYPEPYLVEHALDNATKFGQSRKRHIAKLVDIADLQLVSFDKAEAGIRAALNSPDPVERYWGLIVCSSFGRTANLFAERAIDLAKTDPDPLVRTRAAEFLGLHHSIDPAPIIADALAKSRSKIEAVLVLNSAALLHQTNPVYVFDVKAPKAFAKDRWVQNRIAFIRD